MDALANRVFELFVCPFCIFLIFDLFGIANLSFYLLSSTFEQTSKIFKIIMALDG